MSRINSSFEFINLINFQKNLITLRQSYEKKKI